jgi:hypothetical protein
VWLSVLLIGAALAGDPPPPPPPPSAQPCAGVRAKDQLACLEEKRPNKYAKVQRICGKVPQDKRHRCRVREFAKLGITYGKAAAPKPAGPLAPPPGAQAPKRPMPAGMSLAGLAPGGALGAAEGVDGWVAVTPTRSVGAALVAGRPGALEVQHCGELVRSVAFRGRAFVKPGAAPAGAAPSLGGLGGPLMAASLAVPLDPAECDGAALAPSADHMVCAVVDAPLDAVMEEVPALLAAYEAKYGSAAITVPVPSPTPMGGALVTTMAQVGAGAPDAVTIVGVCDRVEDPGRCLALVQVGKRPEPLVCTGGI